ncbi:MAG: hypothetical protein RLY16_1338, partial [Bacteroidota bacterium]
MKKFLTTGIASVCSILLVSAQQPILGFSKESSGNQLALEKQFDGLLRAENIGQYIKDLSATPHHVASAGGDSNTDYIYKKFKSWGFKVEIQTYQVLFPTPIKRVLELNSPKKFIARLSEPALAEDATSGQTKDQLPIYNCYSADGNVTAELVYVNYGVPADYEKLAQLGVDVKGKIVIAKYGKSWRGIKPKVAQEHGAIGCIIYSDPREDGYFQGDVYPKGPYRPEYGAQRGSVEDMPVYPGDPLTPGEPALDNAKRLKREEATNLLKIPVLPISYADAKPLLENLQGAVVPEDWRGALPITYHVGPSKNKVHLELSFDWSIKPVNNIIATLQGSEFPDEWVIRGNHHDAWVNGAADPISGLAALMEEARVVGELAKTGIKPKRTLMYCAWDGEEAGLLGSTEWVEDMAAELENNAVVYINSDGNGRGFVEAGGSQALEPLFNELGKDVIDPQTGVNILERRRSANIVNASNLKDKKEWLNKKNISLYPLGSGSDYSPFFQHLGIPSLNLGFGGEDDGGEYHSIYDSYDLYSKFKDPGFKYGVTLAQTAGRFSLRFANAEILPFDFKPLQQTIAKYSTEVIALADQLREQAAIEQQIQNEKHYTIADKINEPLLPPAKPTEVPFINFAPLQNELGKLEKTVNQFQDSLKKYKFTKGGMKEINSKLYRAEQMLLVREGLPRRSWYKHSIYAPGFYT